MDLHTTGISYAKKFNIKMKNSTTSINVWKDLKTLKCANEALF